MNSTYSVTANATTQQVRIPVPTGLTAATFVATAQPDNDLVGRIEVLVGTKIVQTVAVDGSGAAVNINAPITGAPVSDGAVQIGLRYLTNDVTDPTDVCLLSNLGSVQLTNVSVETTGTAVAPTTVADFFSPSVSAISIRVDDPSNGDQRQAALTAAAALTQKYGNAARVTVTGADDTTRSVTLDATTGRIVEIRSADGADASTSLGQAESVPALTLSGNGSALDNAARALGDDRLALAGAAQVHGTDASAADPTVTTQRTFADLGASQLSLAGLGQSQASVSVAQAAFGQPISQASVHVVGAHTAVPTGVSAIVSYYWNDQVVDSQQLDGDVQIDRTITIPSTQLRTTNTLRIELDAAVNGQSGGAGAPDGQLCGTGRTILPIQVTFDSKASGIDALTGQTLDPGFTRFPQVLGGVLPIAFGQSDTVDADTLTDAAALVTTLQRSSQQPLTIEQRSADTLIGSTSSGLIVNASSAQVDELGAPLRLGEFRSIDRARGAFRTGVDGSFAVLQAFSNKGRDLLVLADWTPDGRTSSDVDGQTLRHRLADSIASRPYGWSAVYNDLYVVQPTGDPELVDSNSIVPQETRINEYQGMIWWAVGVIVVLAGLLLVGALTRRHMRTRARQIVDGEVAFDEAARGASGGTATGGTGAGGTSEPERDDDTPDRSR